MLTDEQNAASSGVSPDSDARLSRLPHSPRKIDKKLKPPIYLRFGVQYFWMIDPIVRELEVFQAKNGAWNLVDSFHQDDLVRATPFDAYEIDLLVLWGEERPR